MAIEIEMTAARGLPFRVGAFESVEDGLHAQEGLAEHAGEAPLLFAWRTPRGLIVGRTDTRLPGFEAAVERLAKEGWPVIVRRSGGSACPVSPGTLQIALARPVVPRMSIDATYEELVDLIARLLRTYGLEAEAGEKPDAFCPGRYDMSVAGRKLVGMSQHWRQWHGAPTATTAATLIVDEDLVELSRIVDLFYETAGGTLRCSPEAVGSVRQALGASAPDGALLQQDLVERLSAIGIG